MHFERGAIHLPQLGLWLDAHEPQEGPERVFVSHAHSDHTGLHREVILSAATARLMEARLGAILNASGAIYALRRECYSQVSQNAILEDFVIPMRARRLGFSVLYDPEAVAVEFPASTVAGEFTRRVRLAVGSFRAWGELVRVPWRGFTPFALLSHKLLRWLVPFFAVGLLVSNIFLLSRPFYQAALAAQILFYFWAGLGFFFYRYMRRVRYGLVAYFFFAMHLAFLVGFVRCVTGSDKTVWQKVS